MIINNFQSLIRRIDWVSSWTLFDAPGFTLWRSRHFNLKSSKWETPRLLQAYKKLIQVSYKLVQKQSRSVSNFDTVDAFGQFILMFRLICDAFQGGRQLTIVLNESFQVSGSSWSYFLDIHWFERVHGWTFTFSWCRPLTSLPRFSLGFGTHRPDVWFDAPIQRRIIYAQKRTDDSELLASKLPVKGSKPPDRRTSKTVQLIRCN